VTIRLSSVTIVRPTQAVEILDNISAALGTVAIHWHPQKILRDALLCLHLLNPLLKEPFRQLLLKAE